MKLLFDENLSPRLVGLLAAEFPESTHPEALGLCGAADFDLWDLAGAHGLTIVSKDNELRQLAFFRGPPPKVVWLSVGNAGTQAIADLVRTNVGRLAAFDASADEALLVLAMPLRG